MTSNKIPPFVLLMDRINFRKKNVFKILETENEKDYQ